MEYNKPIVIGTYGNQKTQFGQARRIFNLKGISPTLSAAMGMGGGFVPVVLVSPKLTNMPFKSTKNTFQNIRSTVMSQISHGQMLKILKWWSVDFLVKLSRLPENVKVSMIRVAHDFLKSFDVSGKNNHVFYCLKTSKGYYLTTKGKLSGLSSIRWMNLGMTCNGKCLTVRTSVSPRIGKECSLSDILEEQVDQKYFLSEKTISLIKRKTIENKGKRGLPELVQNPRE